VNVPEIIKAVEEAGLEVAISDPRFGVQVDELMGVHGAGLTNAVLSP
jgi:hypothetical protein